MKVPDQRSGKKEQNIYNQIKAVLAVEDDFLTTGKRILGVLGLPFTQPGRIPRGLGGLAGVSN